MNTAYIGLGSNIDAEKNLPEAIRRLSQFVEIEGVSSVWCTEAVGTIGPRFLNAAVRISTEIDSESLKGNILYGIENKMGRVRVADKNAPRTIDLDILVFNEKILDDEIFKRDYLIIPMAELIPELRDESNEKTLRELAQERCCSPAVVRMGALVY